MTPPRTGTRAAVLVASLLAPAATAPAAPPADPAARAAAAGRAGNAGACHGTPSGKNGFRLPLRGDDPAADYLQLTRDQFGRRTDKHDPGSSLMLLKALGRVPHEGGQRFAATSVPGEMMAAW